MPKTAVGIATYDTSERPAIMRKRMRRYALPAGIHNAAVHCPNAYFVDHPFSYIHPHLTPPFKDKLGRSSEYAASNYEHPTGPANPNRPIRIFTQVLSYIPVQHASVTSHGLPTASYRRPTTTRSTPHGSFHTSSARTPALAATIAATAGACPAPTSSASVPPARRRPCARTSAAIRW